MQMKCLGLLIPIFAVQIVAAQLTIRIVKIPANSPLSAEIYCAASCNGWQPNNKAYLFKAVSATEWLLTLPPSNSSISFKCTLGSWATAETDASGNDIPNRNWQWKDKPDTLTISIAGWKMGEKSSAAANVMIMDTAFEMPQLHRKRRIWVYLPPDYATSRKRYPVMYMQDGQNLFDQKTAFSGEWQIDETLNTFSKKGNPVAIIVGIDNGGSKRLQEYAPWMHPTYGGGEGEAYIDFVAFTLKPYIDQHFRTLSSPKNTALAGSSMGGLIATYGALQYPNIFGRAAVLSPSFWFGKDSLLLFINNLNNKTLQQTKIAMVAGEKESASMVTDMQEVQQLLLKKGLKTNQLQLKVDANGQHNESYWRSVFGELYTWLMR